MVVLLLCFFIITAILPGSKVISQGTGTDGASEVVYVKLIYTVNDSIVFEQRPARGPDTVNPENPVFGRKHNNLTFVISRPDSGLVSFRLEGFDPDWTRWQKAESKDYTNLPPGNYSFMVRWMDKGKEPLVSTPLNFRILPAWYFSFPAVICYVLVIFLLVWVIYEQLKYRFARTQYMLEQIINTRTEELIVEKDKTESLLQNVLPKNTADELITKGKVAKTKYNFVTVLFSDIQGFTKIAEETNPEVLIDELDRFFFHFDSVVEKYGIEKIKTIGDAYMCAGGIPEKNRTNPVEIILAALEMQEYMNDLKAHAEIDGIKFWDIRVGIHTGTVVAGVVGQKKLSYDIWGDTVNTASRMESSGEPGKINISGTTYEFVKDFFICRHRGKMPVKYKGEIDMYFVESIAGELKDESNRPNRKFITMMKKLKLLDIEEAVLKYFDDEAPPDLYFHNSAQVRSLCNQTDLLANAGRTGDEDYIPLKLAAIFLYAGYITDYGAPAAASCSLMEKMISRYGILSEDAPQAARLIQNSFSGLIESEADRILHDSKYDYLGRVDYLRLTDRLFREETEYGKVEGREKWFSDQKTVLAKHVFLTQTAMLMRGVGPEEQAQLLEKYGNEMK